MVVYIPSFPFKEGLNQRQSLRRLETPMAPTPQSDRSFVSRLLEIALQFVTKLIQTRVMQIQDAQRRGHREAQMPTKSFVHSGTKVRSEKLRLILYSSFASCADNVFIDI